MERENNPSKFLIVKGVAGIGNRLATLCSAIEYAKKSDRILYVDWSDPMVTNQEQNIFHDYFSLRDCKITHDPRDFLRIQPSTIYPPLYQDNLLAAHNRIYWNTRHPVSRWTDRCIRFLPKGRPRMIRGYWHERPKGLTQSFSLLQFMLGLVDPRSMPLGEDLSTNLSHNVVVFADYIPRFNHQVFLDHVRLLPKLEKRIADLQKRYISLGTVGIHVRHSDKTPKNQSPVETVTSVLKNHQLEERPLFLATDSDHIFESFKKRFPNIQFARTLRPQAAGIPIHIWAEKLQESGLLRDIFEEGIIDLWLLSKCEYLLYQQNSAFTLPSRALHAQPSKQLNWDA